LLFVVGCKSGPETRDADPGQTAPAAGAEDTSAPKEDEAFVLDGETAQTLEAAAARLEAARKQAHDFGGPVYRAEETAAADERYTAVAGAKPGSGEAAREALAAYAALAETYEGIFERALPPFVEGRTAEIREAREDAIFMGILVYSPERLDAADDVSDEALRLYQDEGDYYAARDEAAAAERMYRALALGAEARNEAFEIEFYQFQDLDPENFDNANRIFDEGKSAYDAGDIARAIEAGEESRGLYRGILNQGMKSYAGERRAAALAERQVAEEAKAPVAVKTDFENAAQIFNLGEAAFGREQYREAANLYFQSEFSFAAAAGAAEEKRARAEAAIRRAEELTAASGEVAQSAEDLISENLVNEQEGVGE
jgi:hypothetical protein